MNQHRLIRQGSNYFRRESVRHKLFEPVSMRIDGLSVRGHLLDLSRSGALAYTEAAVTTGARVEIEGFGILTPARIMWIKGCRFGLRFDNWLSDALLTMIVEGVISPDATSEKG